jgi:hypothetical protein
LAANYTYARVLRLWGYGKGGIWRGSGLTRTGFARETTVDGTRLSFDGDNATDACSLAPLCEEHRIVDSLRHRKSTTTLVITFPCLFSPPLQLVPNPSPFPDSLPPPLPPFHTLRLTSCAPPVHVFRVAGSLTTLCSRQTKPTWSLILIFNFHPFLFR